MSFTTHITTYLTTSSPDTAKAVIFSVAIYLSIFILTPFIQNYTRARKTGPRIIISPITPYSLPWRIASSLFRPVLQHFTWYRVIDWTCCWQDASLAHASDDKEVLVVSPGSIVLCTRDEKTIEGVLKNWRGFVKPDGINEILGTFGKNVDTSNGDDWTRHRKIVAPCFSERASARVWSEALTQSNELVDKWLNDKTGLLAESMTTLALNVISAVAFENSNVNEPAAGHTMSLKDALMTVMSTSISPALESLIPYAKIPIVQMFLPRRIRTLMLAMAEFSAYMDALVAREMANGAKVNPSAPLNLIQTLIQANTRDEQGRTRLSDTELRGNIFLFTVGGLESTSTTLTYALSLLAIHPSVQEWVYEEIASLTQSSLPPALGYANFFPKLVRVKAIMFETLRLFSPSPPLPRTHHIPSNTCTLPTSTRPLTLPPATQIMLNAWPVHATTSEWRPNRWVSADTLLSPETFFAWGYGPRICPGVKFSQVEFCSVVVGVLRRVRIAAGIKEVERVLGGSRAEPLLLRVRGEVGVRVVRR